MGQIVLVHSGFFPRCQPNAVNAGMNLLLIQGQALRIALDSDRIGLLVGRILSTNPYYVKWM